MLTSTHKNRFVVGKGPIRAFVLSQLLPFGPSQGLFNEMLAPFGASFQFTIADCLEGLGEHSVEKGNSLEALGDYWKNELKSSRFSFFMGFSLGGCILQHLMDVEHFNETPFVFLSAPTHATPTLKDRLQPVIRFLKEGQTLAGISQLDRLVLPANLPDKGVQLPAGNSDFVSSPQLELARIRLLSGFSILFEHDARMNLRRKRTKTLFMVGSHSQLITKEQVAVIPPHSLWIIPNAGMRVLSFLSADMKQKLQIWLEEPK